MSEDDIGVPQLESDLLRSFLEVARCGSVSGGASRLLRTQSAVSLQLQKLERVLGHQLFLRHGRGVSLTEAGELLLPTARHVIETLDQTAIAIRGRNPSSEIRLGVPEEYSDTLLPTILTDFSQEHPGARIVLRCGNSVEFPALVAKGELDLALHTPSRIAIGDLVILRTAAVWVGSAYHELEKRRPLPVALFDKACWWRERCLELLASAGLEYEVVCTCESVAGLRAAISSGLAVGVLPQGALNDRVRRLPDATLPPLGETPLVLSQATTAHARLVDSLATIISRSVRKIEPADLA